MFQLSWSVGASSDDRIALRRWSHDVRSREASPALLHIISQWALLEGVLGSPEARHDTLTVSLAGHDLVDFKLCFHYHHLPFYIVRCRFDATGCTCFNYGSSTRSIPSRMDLMCSHAVIFYPHVLVRYSTGELQLTSYRVFEYNRVLN